MGGNPSERNSLNGVNVCKTATIYLTFDDGPSPNFGTETVLNVLRVFPLKATFFVNMKNARKDPLRQKKLLQRMVMEGHVIGNHGYEHADPANKKYYNKTSLSAIKEDFVKNEQEVENLYLDGVYSCPTMELARLQGDGRFQPQVVDMIRRDLKMFHAGWDVEFYPNGMFARGKRDWMNIKEVTADTIHPIRDQDVFLMHDRHWDGREMTLFELITFLSSRYTVKPLTKYCSASLALKPPL